MADFKSWSQENLANLAADQQAAIIAQANEHAATLVVLKGVLEFCDELYGQFCKVGVRNAAYRAGKRAIGGNAK